MVLCRSGDGLRLHWTVWRSVGRNRILKVATHPRRGTADRSQYRQAAGVGAEAVIVQRLRGLIDGGEWVIASRRSNSVILWLLLRDCPPAVSRRRGLSSQREAEED